MVHLARLAALEHQADLRARALADQVVVHAGHGQQRGDGRVLGVDAAVGQDEDVRARRATASLARRQSSAIAFSRPAPPASRREQDGQVMDLKAQAPERPLGVLR